ncbi:SDR family oxidoreductase [Burkholderiaceae bacterium FT117]|uniref:SDR family NAD(P)-dependent oxidoreductase n=1 Tax=Zeimonas sediminis TaxID=2944268 RepID=UPI00234300F3|nr:SDR family oxidoreductase [Zeimonas sediminis]MCM5571514.1 SDR family oxidoreductase [Zeimonas sediminis]
MSGNCGSLAGKVAVVTGGSSGIGAASVRQLAEAGARVVIGYNLGAERAEALRAALPGSGHRCARIPLEDPQAIAVLAAELGRDDTRVDILVNSAGFTRPIPHADLETLDDALFGEILLANARGPYSVIRALLPLLKASGDAVVVNVSSISAFTGSGSNIAYCAAKAALDTMTMSLARVFGPEVRFLCVSPGAVATDFVAGRDRSALEKQAVNTPLKRVVEAEDVAAAVMACVTHLRAATGTRIVVDGGRHL